MLQDGFNQQFWNEVKSADVEFFLRYCMPSLCVLLFYLFFCRVQAHFREPIQEYFPI